jgi:hypothetical protein
MCKAWGSHRKVSRDSLSSILYPQDFEGNFHWSGGKFTANHAGSHTRRSYFPLPVTHYIKWTNPIEQRLLEKTKFPRPFNKFPHLTETESHNRVHKNSGPQTSLLMAPFWFWFTCVASHHSYYLLVMKRFYSISTIFLYILQYSYITFTYKTYWAGIARSV